jgi:hypothetical protein
MVPVNAREPFLADLGEKPDHLAHLYFTAIVRREGA